MNDKKKIRYLLVVNIALLLAVAGLFLNKIGVLTLVNNFVGGGVQLSK